MIPRSGVSRRQVPQLKKMLEEGMGVKDISRNLAVMPSVVFQFAKDWGIELTETPESVELQKFDGMIEAEVQRRVAEQLKKGSEKVRVPESKTTVTRPKSE